MAETTNVLTTKMLPVFAFVCQAKQRQTKTLVPGAAPMSGVGDSVSSMKILHTSDWHIGRTFHTHSTLDHLRQVLEALVEVVRQRQIDVVALARDNVDN
ncbi:MAG: hypothetical protein LH624_08820, partial [Cryobacterium sp.]|nr:hypothetical protein [Cryobacterium sp.]